MAGYRITICGNLDAWKLPPDGSLPKTVRQVFNVDAESQKQISDFIDARIGDIVGSGAMKALVTPDHKTLGRLEPWITVPLHMITHVSFKIDQLTGELPVYDRSAGGSILPNGDAAVKQ